MGKLGASLLALGGGGLFTIEAGYLAVGAEIDRSHPAYLIGIALALVGLVLLLWSIATKRSSANATGIKARQTASGSAQATAGQSAISQVGTGTKIAQQGRGNTVNYYEAEKVSHREDDGRIVVDVPPNHLSDYYRSHLTIQADRLVEPFLGKWMRVEGKIEDVTQRHSGVSVAFVDGTYGRLHVWALFTDENMIERLSVLQRGAHIKIIGKIEEVSAFNFRLRDCELEGSAPG